MIKLMKINNSDQMMRFLRNSQRVKSSPNLSHDRERVRGSNFMGMIFISSSKNLLGFLMFDCVLAVLASQEERRQSLIILCVRNIIPREFLLFSIHS